MRRIASGDRFHPFITRDKMDSFSYASYDEIACVIEELGKSYSWVKGLDKETRLRRFLLYRSLESQNTGSLVVGQIVGDSHTIHFPYVKVESRE